MADESAGLLRQPAVDTIRIIFVITALSALLLGYLGLGDFLRDTTEYEHRPWDLLYYDLQLFVLGADPLQQPGPYPLTLDLARFAAPAVTLYAFVEGFRLLSAAELRRIRARKARGHVVVCGDSPLAGALSRRLRAAGQRVVDVRAGLAGPAMPLTVSGDPRDPAVLRAAGLDRATALYACDADSTANIAIGFTAGQARRPSAPPLSVYVHIGDHELCLTLQSRYLVLPHPPGLRMDFFNIDDLAARKLFRQQPLTRSRREPPRLLVVGRTAFARAVIVEAARHWQRAFDPQSIIPLPVTVVDEEATSTLDELTARYPFLRQVCRFTARDADLLHLLTAGTPPDTPDRAVICHDDQEHALKTSMTAERFWRGTPHSVTVRLDQLAAFPNGSYPTGTGGLFAEASGTLRVYGVLHAACDPELISEGLVERLAQVFHDRYRAARHRRGDPPDSDPSLAPWEKLPPEMRESNRQAAEDIGRKLRTIRCVLVPRLRDGRSAVLRDSEIEQLAIMEHERWCATRTADGWRYGERRDNDRRTHPALRDWDVLPQSLRLRNHDIVRDIPMILADAGFQMMRG